MSMVMDYEKLLVIGGVTHLNLKKCGVGWFKRVLEIEFCEMEEMGCCVFYKRTQQQLIVAEATQVNSCWIASDN